MYSHPWSPMPSTTAVAPEFLTAKRQTVKKLHNLLNKYIKKFVQKRCFSYIYANQGLKKGVKKKEISFKKLV